MRHVDLRPEGHRSLGVLALAHLLEEPKILFHRTIPIGAVCPRLGERPLLRCDLLGGLLIDIGQPPLDQVDRKVIELLEVVAGVVDIAPVEAEPLDIPQDRIDILLVLLDGVGIVEADVADPAILLGDAEVHTYRLGVSDMEVAIRLRGKSRLDASVVESLPEVTLHDLLYKIERLLLAAFY